MEDGFGGAYLSWLDVRRSAGKASSGQDMTGFACYSDRVEKGRGS